MASLSSSPEYLPGATPKDSYSCRPSEKTFILQKPTLSHPVSPIASSIFSSIPGRKKSSLSRKAMYSPDARSIPALRAALTPPFGWWITVMRSSKPAKLSQISPLLSRLPSSTRMSSQSVNVCSSTDRTHFSMNFSA